MARISNWGKEVDRNVSDTANGGVLKQWRHGNTGDTISVRLSDEIYTIEINGKVATARNTLAEARDSAIDTMKLNINGI